MTTHARLMAACDLMTSVSAEEIAEQLADHLVKVAIAHGGLNNNEDFTVDHVRVLVAAYLEFKPTETISGLKAEQLFYWEFQAIWQAEMGHETENWNDFDDWNVEYPVDLLKRIARGCAYQQSASAKAFYAYLANRTTLPDETGYRNE